MAFYLTSEILLDNKKLPWKLVCDGTRGRETVISWLVYKIIFSTKCVYRHVVGVEEMVEKMTVWSLGPANLQMKGGILFLKLSESIWYGIYGSQARTARSYWQNKIYCR